jgi:hypothetical protein
MSRQTYFLGLGMALVALAFVVTDEFFPGTPVVTERNCKRIRPGMTLGEVEDILGLEPGTGGCVSGPGFYPWWQVKGFLTYLEDPQRLHQFVARVRQVNPGHFAGAYNVNFYYRELASDKGLEVGFLSKADGGFVMVYFGERGRVRRARWLADEHVRKTFAPKTTPLDRLRSRLGW